MTKIQNLVCYYSIVVLIIWTRFGLALEYSSYNSSDISYLSNGIQFPIDSSQSIESMADDGEFRVSFPEMKWLSLLYDHFRWGSSNVRQVSEECRTHVITYVKELKNSTSWAVKMFDASGRYVGQFFFGNDYWVGSKPLCNELTNTYANEEVPPFPVRFTVAKIRININEKLTPVTRQLNLGQCLPASCTESDVRTMLAQEHNQGRSLNIVGVRKVPGDYKLWRDVKFQIVGGTAAVVAFIAVIASIVETIIEKRQEESKKDVEESNNNNNENNNNCNNSKSQVTGSREKVVVKDNIKGKTKLNGLLKFLLCFSAVNNCNKILNVQNMSKDSIACIHGIRVFSIGWIILVHTYLEVFAIGENKRMRVVTEREFLYQTISNATFSVDSFFFISGLLVTLTYFKTQSKLEKSFKEEPLSEAVKKNSLKFIILIIYRFFRLTPAYLFVLGVNELTLRYVNNEAVFTPAMIDDITCNRYWWRNALYINNFFRKEEFCMLWSWYIANDTQFYVLTIILLLIAVRGEKHLKFAGALLGVFMIASTLTTFIIAMRFEFEARVEEPFALFDQLYDKPWLRITPYLVGIMTGYFLFTVQGKLKIPILLVVMGWILSISCLGSLVYGLGRNGLVIPVSAFYAALGHTAWAVCLAWITIACRFGYGGLLNSVFSNRLFVPLSRLTYCAYLVHPVLMVLTSLLLEGPLHLHLGIVIVIYCGNVALSFFVALGISVLFEAPTVNILKLTFG